MIVPVTTVLYALQTLDIAARCMTDGELPIGEIPGEILVRFHQCNRTEKGENGKQLIGRSPTHREMGWPCRTGTCGKS
jgi:hypothetical protein